MGNSTPTHLYAPGAYTAAVQFADNQGHTGLALLNVQVDELPPEVSAGSDQTVDAGTAVAFSGTATDPSGIATIEWDFDYDWDTFTADPSATGTPTPTHTYLDPGTYEAALRVVDNDGSENIDVITVTVNDTAPVGTVTLATTRPDGTEQTLVEGAPVYFAVAGMRDTDPADMPDVWADWDGDGDFDLIAPDEWEEVTTGADGSESFLIAHTFDDNGGFSPVFVIEDVEGDETESSVPVSIANANPSAVLADPPPPAGVGQPVVVSFTSVTDPSQADTEAGFTYYFAVDGGAWQTSDEPELILENLAPGSSHTVQAYVADKDGGMSPSFAQAVQVFSDQEFINSGAGSVQLNWTNQDGTAESRAVAGGQSLRFLKEIAGLSVTLLNAGTTYDFASNFAFDQVNGNGLAGVNLTVRTDRVTAPLEFVGDGHIGLVSVGESSTVTVVARGDFGGLSGGPNSFAQSLTFRNQTGPILADSAGQIVATGAISGIDLNAGVNVLSGYSVGNVRTHNQPERPVGPITLTYGPGGNTGAIIFTGQRPTIYTLDAANRVVSYQDGPASENRYVSYTYAADGLPATAVDRYGTWTFGRDANGQPVVATRPPSAPNGAKPGDGTPPATTRDSATPSWAESVWSGAVAVYDSAGNLVQSATQTIAAGAQTIYAFADEQWTRAGETVTWAVDAAHGAALYLGDQVVQASRDVAEGFMKEVEAFGGTLSQLWTKLGNLVANSGATLGQILTDFVNDPVQFATRLFTAVSKGFTDFLDQNTLPTTLTDAVLKWLFSNVDVSQLSPLPTDWTDLTNVGEWLVDKFFGLNWDNVQAILVDVIGPGNVALAGQVLEAVQAAATSGQPIEALLAFLREETGEDITAQSLAQMVMEKAATEAAQRVIPPILAEVTAAFATGGVGKAVTAVYRGVTWLEDNLNRLQGMTDLLSTIAGEIHAVVTDASGAAGTKMAGDITDLLKRSVPAVLSFAATQAGLGNLPATIRGTAQKVQGYPTGLIRQAAAKVLGKAKQKLQGLGGSAAIPGLVGYPVSLAAGGHTVKLWVVNQNGAAVVMRSVDGRDVRPLDLDLPAVASPTAAQQQARQKVIDALTQLKADAAAAIQAEKNLRSAPPSATAGGPASTAAALSKSITTLAGDLKAEVVALQAAGATCFFGQACFAAGTPLRTPGGWRAVEALRPGDAVLSRDEHDPHGPVEAKVVEEVFVYESQVLYLTVGGQRIGTTSEHPFYVPGRGWVAAGELRPGDVLAGHDGQDLAVRAIEVGAWATVYNMRVADHHTYFVGCPEWGFSVWAHNECVYHYGRPGRTVLPAGTWVTNVGGLFFDTAISFTFFSGTVMSQYAFEETLGGVSWHARPVMGVRQGQTTKDVTVPPAVETTVQRRP